jgi:hypothetical protein
MSKLAAVGSQLCLPRVREGFALAVASAAVIVTMLGDDRTELLQSYPGPEPKPKD